MKIFTTSFSLKKLDNLDARKCGRSSVKIDKLHISTALPKSIEKPTVYELHEQHKFDPFKIQLIDTIADTGGSQASVD